MKGCVKKVIFGETIINIYIAMFIFSMINREFSPFNIDLRYVQIIIAIIILGSMFIKNARSIFNIKMIDIKGNICKNKYFWLVIAMYLMFFISNFRWLNNQFEYNKSDFLKMNILYIYNLMTIIMVYINRDRIKINYVVKSIITSCIILFASMILIWVGYNANDIMATNYPLKYSGGDHFNFIGGIDRIAGYAQDPNYASFFMLLLVLTTIFYVSRKSYKIIFLSIGVIGYMLSASKTLIVAILAIVVYYVLKKIIKSEKIYSYMDKILFIGLTIGPVILIKVLLSYNKVLQLDTMRTRMSMWNSAVGLFNMNPISGNGITSFRAYYESTPTGWYVHSHNTSLQILSESGLINFLIYLVIVYMIFNRVNLYGKCLIISYLVFSMTYELTYLSIFAFILGVLIIFKNDLVKEY